MIRLAQLSGSKYLTSYDQSCHLSGSVALFVMLAGYDLARRPAVGRHDVLRALHARSVLGVVLWGLWLLSAVAGFCFRICYRW